MMADTQRTAQEIDGDRYDPPNDVDAEQVAEMVEIVEAGGTLPPILVTDTGWAITGSHRIAAHSQADLLIDAIEVPMSDIEAAAERQGRDAQEFYSLLVADGDERSILRDVYGA